MVLSRAVVIPVLGATLALHAGAALSQQSGRSAAPSTPASTAPSALVLYFDLGSAKVRSRDEALLETKLPGSTGTASRS